MVKDLICVLLIDFPLPPINWLTQIMEKLVLTQWVRNVVIYCLLIQHSCVYTYSLAHEQRRQKMFPLLNQLVLCPSIRKGLLATCHQQQHPLYDLPLQHRPPTLQSCFARAPARIKIISWTPLQKPQVGFHYQIKSIAVNVFWRLCRAMICPLQKFPSYDLICNLKLVSMRNIFSLFAHRGQKKVVWHKRLVHFTNLIFYI